MKNKIGIKLTVVKLCAFFFISCSSEKSDHIFAALDSDSNNVFNIKKTNYRYRGAPIFTINLSLSAPSDFIKTNYIVIDKNRLYQFGLYADCKMAYQKNEYKINPSPDRDIKNYNKCDIVFLPILDFSLSKFDSIKVSDNHWITLVDRFFDTNLQDSVYKFERQWGNHYRSTIIFAAKSKGIIGTYQIDKLNTGFMRSSFIGKTYVKQWEPLNSEHLIKPNIQVRLSDIKKFEKE